MDVTSAAQAPTPREGLRMVLTELRRVILSRPAVGLILSTSGNNPPGQSTDLLQWGVSQLRDIGLTGTDLVTGYQVLEGFVIGLANYDLSSQPNPLETRRQWYRSAEVPEFDEISRDTTQIAAISEATFALGLEAILDKLETLAKR